jgi:REP element-mobilizing transposase RayT
MSAVTAIYHIVINTYRREMTLPLTSCDNLYRYIARVVQNKQSTLLAINGIENHIHLLVNLHPSVCLSDLIRDIKLSTSQWIKGNHASFPQFSGWGKEYGAFTYAMRDKEMVTNYIRNQRTHHQRESFEDEYRKHVANVGLEWNEYRLT